MVKIGQGLLRLMGQSTRQTLRLVSSQLSFLSDSKAGFPATTASVLVMHLGSGVRLSGYKYLLGEWS